MDKANKLLKTFQETSTSVKKRLKTNGFILPVKHLNGIKFKHCFIFKNNNGWYDVVNLHNMKNIYKTNISNIKLAVAYAIYVGCKTRIRERDFDEIDHEYLHYLNEVRLFQHQIAVSKKANNQFKADILQTRLDIVQTRLYHAKNRVNRFLDMAESLLFENK